MLRNTLISAHLRDRVLWAMAVTSCAAVLVGTGALVARSPFALAVASLAVVSFVCPRWLLLAGAIVSSRALVGDTVIGQLQASDILLVVFLLRWLGGVLSSGVGRAVAHSSTIWLGSFLVWAWISLVLAGAWQTGWALGRISLYAAVFLVASTDSHHARPLLRFIAVYACVEALLALFGVTPDPGNRIYGLYGDPGQTGALMLAGLVSARTLPKVPRRAAYALLGVAIVLTFTRGVWVAGSVSLIVVAWPNLRTRLARAATIVAIALAAAWWLIPLATAAFNLWPASIDLRVQSWSLGLDLIGRAPIVGSGWAVGTVALRPEMPPPFNLWINVAASTGLVGAFLLTGFLVQLTTLLAHAREQLPRIWFQYLVAFLVLSLGEMTLWAAGPTTIEFFTLTGAVVGLVGTTLTPSAQGGVSPHTTPQHLPAPLLPRRR